MLFCKYQYWNF